MWENTWQLLWAKGNKEINPSQIYHSEDRTTYHRALVTLCPLHPAKLSFPHHKGQLHQVTITCQVNYLRSNLSTFYCNSAYAVTDFFYSSFNAMNQTTPSLNAPPTWTGSLHLSNPSPTRTPSCHQLTTISKHNLRAATKTIFSSVAENSWWMFCTEKVGN